MTTSPFIASILKFFCIPPWGEHYVEFSGIWPFDSKDHVSVNVNFQLYNIESIFHYIKLIYSEQVFEYSITTTTLMLQ